MTDDIEYIFETCPEDQEYAQIKIYTDTSDNLKPKAFQLSITERKMIIISYEPDVSESELNKMVKLLQSFPKTEKLTSMIISCGGHSRYDYGSTVTFGTQVGHI